MTDLEPPVDHKGGPPAVSVCLEVLKKRADFVATSKGRRHGTQSVHLQGRKRAQPVRIKGKEDAHPALIRVGFTCSKKVGNAVARNRAKRRLREVARAVLPTHGRAGWDYVLVGRPDTTGTLPLPQLQADLIRALTRIHA